MSGLVLPSWENGESFSISFRETFGLVLGAGYPLDLVDFATKVLVIFSCVTPLSSKFSITATDICLWSEGFRETCESDTFTS